MMEVDGIAETSGFIENIGLWPNIGNKKEKETRREEKEAMSTEDVDCLLYTSIQAINFMHIFYIYVYNVIGNKEVVFVKIPSWDIWP